MPPPSDLDLNWGGGLSKSTRPRFRLFRFGLESPPPPDLESDLEYLDYLDSAGGQKAKSWNRAGGGQIFRIFRLFRIAGLILDKTRENENLNNLNILKI